MEFLIFKIALLIIVAIFFFWRFRGQKPWELKISNIKTSIFKTKQSKSNDELTFYSLEKAKEYLTMKKTPSNELEAKLYLLRSWYEAKKNSKLMEKFGEQLTKLTNDAGLSSVNQLNGFKKKCSSSEATLKRKAFFGKAFYSPMLPLIGPKGRTDQYITEELGIKGIFYRIYWLFIRIPIACLCILLAIGYFMDSDDGLFVALLSAYISFALLYIFLTTKLGTLLIFLYCKISCWLYAKNHPEVKPLVKGLRKIDRWKWWDNSRDFKEAYNQFSKSLEMKPTGLAYCLRAICSIYRQRFVDADKTKHSDENILADFENAIKLAPDEIPYQVEQLKMLIYKEQKESELYKTNLQNLINQLTERKCLTDSEQIKKIMHSDITLFDFRNHTLH